MYQRAAWIAVLATLAGFLAVGIHDLAIAAARDPIVDAAPAQSFAVVEQASIPADRDDYTVTTFTVVQWPLDPATAVSSDFGPRVPPCAGCSSDHRGVDWTPGAGTAVVAIADGIVTEIGGPSGELGVVVVIRHDVDGVVVSSVSGHLRAGSTPLAVGDTVARGSLVGTVGSTGLSTGPHLHFGILDAGGTAVDPLAWLAAHVTEPPEPPPAA